MKAHQSEQIAARRCCFGHAVRSKAHQQSRTRSWQIDASPVDALCTRRAAFSLCVWWNRDAAFLTYISKTPRASAVWVIGSASAILAWGVPDTIKTDNGSDFTAQETSGCLRRSHRDGRCPRRLQPGAEGPMSSAQIKTYQHQFVQLVQGYCRASVRRSEGDRGPQGFCQPRLGRTLRGILMFAFGSGACRLCRTSGGEKAL